MNKGIESLEFVRLRSDQFAMAAHEAARHITGTMLAPGGVETLAAAREMDAHLTWRGVCLGCSEWRQMAMAMHVCERCFLELEDER